MKQSRVHCPKSKVKAHDIRLSACLTGMKGMKGMGKISAECKVQGAEKKTVQGPKPAHRSLVRSFALSHRHSDTPLPRYQLFLSPLSPLSLLNPF
jgi:hypothetical protein